MKLVVKGAERLKCLWEIRRWCKTPHEPGAKLHHPAKQHWEQKEAGVIKRSMWNTLGKNKSFVKWTCVQMVRDGKNNIWQVKCRTSKHTNPTKQCKGKWNTKNVRVIKLAWVVLKKSGAGELNCWSQQRLVHSKGMGWPEDGSLSRRKSSELFAYVFPLKEPGGVHTGILPYGELHRKSVLNRSAFRRD